MNQRIKNRWSDDINKETKWQRDMRDERSRENKSAKRDIFVDIKRGISFYSQYKRHIYIDKYHEGCLLQLPILNWHMKSKITHA